ncbi:MAG TPA: hypothetical protein VGE22_11585 [Solimonas sp.]
MPTLHSDPARGSWGLRLKLYGLVARALTGLALAKLLRRAAPSLFMPRPEWEPLPGPHPVGVRDVDLLDTHRPEPERPGERRRIMARVWYPAAPHSQPRRRFHSAEEAAWFATNGPRAVRDLEALSDIETWSAQDAPALPGPARFPLLLFSHGLGGSVSQNTHLCERLASCGYVVVSITHPFGGASLRYASGDEALVTPQLLKRRFDLAQLAPIVTQVRLARTAQAAARAASGLLTVAGLKPELRIWVDDTSAVLDLLQAGETSPAITDVLRLVDFSRVGALGMSFGGATSAAVAQRDERIGAAVNLDGNQFGDELWDTTIRVPLLELRSDEAMIESGGSFNNFHYERFAESGTSGRVWRYHVRGSTHAGFTDMVLLGSPLQHRLMNLGRIPGTRMTALMFDLTRRFFDRHLKDDAAAWESEPSARWTELQKIDTQELRRLS